MKAYRHRVDCHSPEGRFLGGAEFKTHTPSAAALVRKLLLSLLNSGVRLREPHEFTFSLNQEVVRGQG